MAVSLVRHGENRDWCAWGERQMDGSTKHSQHSQHSRHAHAMCIFTIGESGR